MNKNINKKGFTIIEVVLVLAIAGLIFLMVFVALPRLQSSQRDTQRRDDVAAVATAVTQYQTNNGGKLPANSNDANASTFIEGYLLNNGATFNVPNSQDGYKLLITEASADTTLAAQGADEATVVIVKKATCGDDGALTYSNQTRDYAVGIQLEGAGYYCTDN